MVYTNCVFEATMISFTPCMGRWTGYRNNNKEYWYWRDDIGEQRYVYSLCRYFPTFFFFFFERMGWKITRKKIMIYLPIYCIARAVAVPSGGNWLRSCTEFTRAMWFRGVKNEKKKKVLKKNKKIHRRLNL